MDKKQLTQIKTLSRNEYQSNSTTCALPETAKAKDESGQCPELVLGAMGQNDIVNSAHRRASKWLKTSESKHRGLEIE
jgi:hypothetical protein